jgi:transcriptional regulator with XRE-family HTH domain
MAETDMRKAKRKTKSPRSPSAVDEYIGARMREARRALSMTQESLGDTFQQVQKYEKGSNRVSAARLFEICEALEVSLASMFERKLKRSRPPSDRSEARQKN